MSEVEALPEGWSLVKLSDIVQPVESTDPKVFPSERLSYIDIGSIDNDLGVVISPKVILGKDAPSRAKQIVLPGDTLFSTVRPYLLAIAQVPVVIDNPIASTGFCVLRAEHGINSNYLFLLSRSETFLQSILPLQRGVSYPAVRTNDVLSRLVPVAPEKEQPRIVEKLEELLSDLDNGVAELKAAQTKLGHYRQSLLKSAVEGQLTEQWRAENRDEISETGQQLLERILKERRQRWEQQKLAEFAAKDKKPPKNWQAKYPEPVLPDTAELPELPEGWVWASLSQLGWLDRGRSKHRPRNAKHLYDGPYPFVQTGDIREADTYITSSSRTYSEAGLAQSKLWPEGTMCITIAANIGETAILGIEACFPDSVVGFNPVISDMPVEYIEFLFRTIKQKLEADAPATAQKNINLEILSRVVLPLAPVTEQQAIVETLQTEIEQIDKQKLITEHGLKQSEAQRKNILKDAFSGKLVPQNPGDEPASVLLEKIQAERAEKARHPKNKRTRNQPKLVKATSVPLDSHSADQQVTGMERAD